jgi:hypothetical protein
VQAEFAQLYKRLLEGLLGGAGSARLRANLRQAANEAAAIAWTTPYPLLVTPILFEEKARAARSRNSRQSQIQARSELILSSAF